MTDPASVADLAAFREVVFDDARLLARLLEPAERAVYVAKVVALGAERGFVFDEAAVWSALRAGEATWLTHGNGEG